MRWLTMILLAFGVTSPLRGQTEVVFHGVVEEVPTDLQSVLEVGATMSGTYTFDESLGVGKFLTTITDFEMTIGDYVVQMPDMDPRGDITVESNEYTAVAFATGEPIDGLQPFLMALQLRSDDQITDLDSPLPPPLSELTEPEWTVDFSLGGDAPLRVLGSVESFVVPEPSGAAILLSALLLTCRIRRRGTR